MCHDERRRLQWYMLSFVNYTMMSYPVTRIYMSNTYKLMGIFAFISHIEAWVVLKILWYQDVALQH